MINVGEGGGFGGGPGGGVTVCVCRIQCYYNSILFFLTLVNVSGSIHHFMIKHFCVCFTSV